MSLLLEGAAVATGAAGVYLSVRESPWTWPVSLVNAVLYALVFREAKLYADAGLQGVYAVLAVYGAYAWLGGVHRQRPLAVRHVRRREAWALGGIGVLLALGLSLVLRRTDASLPWLDSALTGGSLVAQWLVARKVVESWSVWLAVDVVYVGLFLHQALYPTAALYVLFLVLAVMGRRAWMKSAARAPA